MEFKKTSKLGAKKIVEGIISALLVLILILISDQKLMDPVLLPRFLAFSFFLLILGIYSVFIRPNRSFSTLRDPLLWAYLTFVVLGLLSLFYSSNPADGFFEWLKIAYGLIFLWLLLSIKPTPNTIVYINVFIAFFTILSVSLQLATLSAKFDLTLHTTYLVSGPFAHKNLLAQILLMTLPFSFWAVFRVQNFVKYLGLFNIIVTTFLIIILLSRGVWVATILSLVGTAAVYGFTVLKTRKDIKWKAYRRPFLFLTSGIVLTLVGVAVFFSQTNHEQTFTSRVESVTDLNNVHTKDRIGLWKRSWTLFTEKPIQGHGIGSWKIEVVKLGTHGLKTNTGEITYVRPHNDYFWVLTEQGILGFIPYIIVLVLGLVYLIRNVKNDPSNRLFYLASIFSYLSFLSVSFFSFPKERVEHLVLFHLLVAGGMIAKFAHKGKNDHQRIKGNLLEKIIFGIATIIILVGTWVGWQRYQGEAHVSRAIDLQHRAQWDRALKELNAIDLFWLPLDHTATPIELYTGSIYVKNYKPKYGCSAYQRALEKHAWHPSVLNGLAQCYRMSGQMEKAEEFYLKALLLTPRNNQTLVELAVMYFDEKKDSMAIEAVKKIDPQWQNARYDQVMKKAIDIELDSIKSAYPEEKLTRYLQDSIQKFPKIDFIYREAIYRKTSFKSELEKYIQ